MIARRKHLQRLFYEDLRILPRHEHVLVDSKRKSHEFLLPGQMLQRDMRSPPHKQRLVSLQCFLIHACPTLRQKHCPGNMRHIRKQQPCIIIRILDLMRSKILCCTSYCLAAADFPVLKY